MANHTLAQCLLAALGGYSSLVAFPNQANYSSSIVRPYNLDYPVVPAAVTFPQTTQQVADVVKCAAQSGYKVQPKSGGHSYGNYGSSTGEISVNLENLRQFTVNNTTHVATVGGGLLLGDVSQLLYNAARRFIPHGTCLQVGIGGHATVGGAGPPSRLYQLTVDHIEEVEVVLANATTVRASQTHNEDLFFAIRGAGASFGIVTEFKFRTEPAPEQVINYVYEWTAKDAASRAQIFRSWQHWISNSSLPRQLSSTLTINPNVTLLAGAYFGSQQGFDKLQIPKTFPVPQFADTQLFTNFLELEQLWGQQIQDSGIADPSYFYSKSLAFLPQTTIPDRVVDEVFQYLATAKNNAQFWALNFEVGRGAISDVAVDTTAFSLRESLFIMLSYVNSKGRLSKTTVNFLNGLNTVAKSGHPDAFYGEYVGYVDPREANQKARRGYWGNNLSRLTKIKGKFDPEDVFHNQQSVRANEGGYQ
ncbi:MAG: hypothetical protein Q9225_006000 [Loekoesia sp. 1 TL-2023]